LLTVVGGAVAVAFSFFSVSNAFAELVQPKRPLSAYILWMNENRDKIVKNLGTKDILTVGKAAGEKWGDLADKDKQKYQKKADALKAEYETALTAFKDAGGIVKKASRKKAKDPNAPKRPLSPNLLFNADQRPSVKKRLGKDAKNTEVMKVLAEEWEKLSDKKKQPYKAKAAKAREAYAKELK
jgi:hypothetical protein